MVKYLKEAFKNDFLIVFLAALISLCAKLIFSYFVVGTNDIISNLHIWQVLKTSGTFRLYEYFIDGCYYNHPPFTLWMLNFVVALGDYLKLGFPYMFRLIPIVSDFLSIFLVWKLLTIYKAKHKILICLVCAFNPINFLVTAFHGSNDSILILLILTAIYFMEKENYKLSGLFFGLSLCIKIVPIMLIPVFFFYPARLKNKLNFMFCSLIFPLFFFAPYLIFEFKLIFRGVFSYKSLVGIWGITGFLKDIYAAENINESLRIFAYEISKWYALFFRYVFFAVSLIFSKNFISIKKVNLTEGVFFIFLLFFVLSSGFGVQYLVWISFLSLIVFFRLGVIYALLGAFFLYRVYNFWGGWTPPFFANSWQYGQWSGFERFLDIILWCYIVFMLIKFILAKAKVKAQAGRNHS